MCAYTAHITKTYLYKFDQLKPHFYIVKLGFKGVYIIFLITAQNIQSTLAIRLSRRKIWSLFQHGNLTIGNKILWKRGEIAPEEQFLLFFYNIFSIPITSGVTLLIHLLNAVV